MKKIKKILSIFVVFFTICVSFAFDIKASVNEDKYYPEPYDLHWSGSTAKWSVDGWAAKYQVTLFRNGSKVTTKTTKSKSYSFSSQLSRGNSEYYFQVRAYNKDSDWWSDWAESSIKRVTHSTDTGKKQNIPVPGAAPGEIASIITNSGKWVQNNGYWNYRFNNGTYAQNTWLNVNGKWYFVDSNYNMVTGWLNLNGVTYFFNIDGTMVTGTVIFDGITHFFDSTGAMIY